MAMLAIINEEAFGKLPEALKTEYKKQNNGTYLLDVTSVSDFALENVKGLKSALSAERTAREIAESNLKAFEGLDAQAAKDALKKIKEFGDMPTEGKVKEQIESIKKQLEDKHRGELGVKDTSITTLTKQLEKLMIEATAIKAISENKGNIELLLPHVRSSVKMKQLQSGEFVVEVVDDKGQARISPATGSTAQMSIAELIAEMKTKDTFAPAFEGTGASGSGATGGKGSGSANANTLAELGKLPPTERLKRARELGIKT